MTGGEGEGGGGFPRELKAIVTGVPSVIVLPTEENQSLEVSVCVWRRDEGMGCV